MELWARTISSNWNHFNLRVNLIADRYVDGLAQDCSNSIANALELLQSWANAIDLFLDTYSKRKHH